MGLPMATNLLSAGFEVSGWARRQEGVQRGADAGLTMRPTLQALAEDRGYVVTMLTASEDLLDVALRSGGLVESMPKGSVLIDMSTVAPAASRQVAELCRENGLDFLDAPVSGGVTGAEHGTLTVMVGGEAAVLERCRPLLEV